MDERTDIAGTIVLVSCYEMGHEPLGITIPAGVLQRAGFSPVLMDVAIDDFDEEIVASASFVGISAPMHTALQLGLRVAARVRQLNPGAHICFFGLYAELNADRMNHDLADSWLGAEFENDLSELVTRVVSAADPRAAIAPDHAPARERSSRRIDLTPHRKTLRGRDRYVQLDRGDNVLLQVGYTAATRGCKHVCRHCPLPAAYDGAFYAIPADRVLADIASLVADGAHHITFADPDFLNGPAHAERIVRRLHAEFPEVSFDYTAKVEHLLRYRDLVVAFGQMNNAFVVSAVESLNDTVLKNLAKNHTREDVITLIRFFREHGLVLRPSLLPFTPWETRASLTDLLETIAREDLVYHIDPVQYTIRLLIPPGSLLLASPAMNPHIGPFQSDALSYAWTHPDPEMDALHARMAVIVEGGASGDPALPFGRLLAAARGEANGESPPLARLATRPPRLTEAWFC